MALVVGFCQRIRDRWFRNQHTIWSHRLVAEHGHHVGLRIVIERTVIISKDHREMQSKDERRSGRQHIAHTIQPTVGR